MPQRETTPFYPRAVRVAKLYAYWITVNYREAYRMHASNGIFSITKGRCEAKLSSPARSPARLLRSILVCSEAVSGQSQREPRLGPCARLRRGDVADLQQSEPDDYVLATGEEHSVREFVEKAFARVGRTIQWRGKDAHEKGVDAKDGKVLVEIDPRYYRPTEVERLLGDPTKARQRLGWHHKVTFDELVREMVASTLRR